VIRSLLRTAPLFLTAFLLASCGNGTSAAPGGTISVVAAENEYGSIASAVGGKYVLVTSLLDNPNTDPHEFEAGAASARTVSSSQLVIENGLGYDSWLDKLLSASPNSRRRIINVGSLLGLQTGGNPHAWYLPSGWPKEAHAIATALGTLDPAHRAYFAARSKSWLRSLQPVYREIAAVRSKVKGTVVISTEPVYGYMLDALHLTSLDYSFQKAIMDGTDPSPRSVADFQAALQHHTAHMLFYNSQVTDPTTDRMRSIARQYHVPLLGVTETQPPSVSFAQWQLSQLKTLSQKW
jgi:zinc/manganese transport system substrate-binding protein